MKNIIWNQDICYESNNFNLNMDKFNLFLKLRSDRITQDTPRGGRPYSISPILIVLLGSR